MNYVPGPEFTTQRGSLPTPRKPDVWFHSFQMGKMRLRIKVILSQFHLIVVTGLGLGDGLCPQLLEPHMETWSQPVAAVKDAEAGGVTARFPARWSC